MTADTQRPRCGGTVWQSWFRWSLGLSPAQTGLSINGSLCLPGWSWASCVCPAWRGVFLFFVFFSFVTRGTKHSLVVNRMWVYIIRGGLIKKIGWFFFLHSVQKMTKTSPPPPQQKLSWSVGVSLRGKGVQIRTIKGSTQYNWLTFPHNITRGLLWA